MSEFTKVGTIHDITHGRPLVYDFDYNTVVVFQVEDEYFCLEDECSHQEVPLSDGQVRDCRVECTMHGSWFDLRTGKALNLPAVKPVKTYAVKVVGEDIYVETPAD